MYKQKKARARVAAANAVQTQDPTLLHMSNVMRRMLKQQGRWSVELTGLVRVFIYSFYLLLYLMYRFVCGVFFSTIFCI